MFRDFRVNYLGPDPSHLYTGRLRPCVIIVCAPLVREHRRTSGVAFVRTPVARRRCSPTFEIDKYERGGFRRTIYARRNNYYAPSRRTYRRTVKSFEKYEATTTGVLKLDRRGSIIREGRLSFERGLKLR